MSEFDDILREAVADITVHGYDDRARVDQWLVRLREAARAALVPENLLQQRLVKALGNRFRQHMRLVNIKRRHPGLAQFTLQQLEPSLQRELQRRILASAKLITLNRDASINRTLQRFEGWATSVPKGGSRAVDRTETTKKLRRAFASLPFEERRVIVDQGHKLIASIDEVLATDGGAVAAVWHSHWRETGYDYRPRHKQFDQRVFVVRGNWALKQGLVKLGGQLYTDQIEKPAELPFCRCFHTYLYSLADVPAAMLTAKGKMALREGDRHAAYG
jgi:hypothetical protein